MTRRVFDTVAAGLGLMVLAPLLLLIAALVKLGDRGAILHRATRMGRQGRTFTLYKFRTMAADAHLAGPAVTVRADPRVTAIGRPLRASKLDELPQLFNVIRGDMALVGPRPEDPRYLRYYTKEQREVLSVRPGITSPASIRFRSEEEILSGEDWERTYVGEVLPAKLALELRYLERRSLWADLLLLAQTVMAIFSPGRRPEAG
jgi:lipopolysaccharide/colanic/teichoic acid biosynthesis glycosyltransferase